MYNTVTFNAYGLCFGNANFLSVPKLQVTVRLLN